MRWWRRFREQRTPVARARAGTHASAFPADRAAAHPARLSPRDGGGDLRTELRAGRAIRPRGLGGHPPGPKLKPRDIAAIGSHGQTIHHLPNAHTPSTLQIGEPAVIAERTGITTVADFRVRDMAAGGQGAPLVPYADWALFTDRHAAAHRAEYRRHRQPDVSAAPRELDDVIAFDTGPGNMVMDALVSGADSRAGKRLTAMAVWRRAATYPEKLLAELMAHPFLRRRPPKTTGREEFGEVFVGRLLASARRLRLRGEDMVATATALTAASIADAYRRFVFPKLKAARAWRAANHPGRWRRKESDAAPHVGSANRRGRVADATRISASPTPPRKPGVRHSRARDFARPAGQCPERDRSAAGRRSGQDRAGVTLPHHHRPPHPCPLPARESRSIDSEFRGK